MILVIILVVALTFNILNKTGKNKDQSSYANETPTVDINPYPNISKECTFDLTLASYHAMTGPGCKGGYSRYNLTDIKLGDKTLEAVIIYSDKNGPKSGLYINKTKVINKVDNLINIRLGIFDNKLFILNKNNNEANVLVYNSLGENVYNLKDTLENLKLSEPNFQTVSDEKISTKNIDPNSFAFAANNFTFKTRLIVNNQIINGSNYIVNFTGEDFEDPIIKG